MKKLFLILLVIACSMTLTACVSQPKKDLALEQVRSQLEKLKEDEDLQGYAPLALGEAERALRQAENARGDKVQRIHLIYMADRRIQIARTVAQRASSPLKRAIIALRAGIAGSLVIEPRSAETCVCRTSASEPCQPA